MSVSELDSEDRERQKRYDLPGHDFLISMIKPKKLSLNKTTGKDLTGLFFFNDYVLTKLYDLDPELDLARHRRIVSTLKMKNADLKTHFEVQNGAFQTVLKNEVFKITKVLEAEFDQRVKQISTTFMQEVQFLKDQFLEYRVESAKQGNSLTEGVGSTSNPISLDYI